MLLQRLAEVSPRAIGVFKPPIPNQLNAAPTKKSKTTNEIYQMETGVLKQAENG